MGKQKRTAEDADVEAQKRIIDQHDEDMAGGFLPGGSDAEEPDDHRREAFFPTAHEEDEDDNQGGGFLVEGHDEPGGPKMGQAYATPQSLEFATKGGTAPISEEDAPAPAPAPKKRGRPPGSANKKTKAAAKTPVKRAAPEKKLPARKDGRTKAAKAETHVEDSEQDDDDVSSLSSLPPSDESDSDADSDVEKQPKKAPTKRAPAQKAGRRATLPAKPAEMPRQTPRRQAARKSETALKSHYFEHDEDEDEDE
jgi:xeroderma pigmentosum group C-complementing protein